MSASKKKQAKRRNDLKVEKVDNSTKSPRRNWRKTFLDTLRNTANVRAACQAANVTRSNAYKFYHKDKKFAALWDEALEDACDVLEARAWKRAEVSDQILMFLLKAHRPNKYADRLKQEITGANGQELFNHGVIAGLLAPRPSGDSSG